MNYTNLGNTDIKVSKLCLGTMTWGEQNTEAEGHQQMDYALEQGINFFDTAEMYAIPPKAETYGKTETIIGNWLHKRQHRDKIILASKVVGSSAGWLDYIREGKAKPDQANIRSAIEGSLKRLQTDYLDLYQIHWPERKTNFFGQLGYTHQEESDTTPILDTLNALAELVKEGKVRSIGISNETPWGTMKFAQYAEQFDLPKIVTIQNPYNLLNRSFEVGLAEVCHRENIGLLAYSPLGFGALSGKYLNGQKPAGARVTLFKEYQRYTAPNATKATEEYVALANDIGITPSQLALAFINQQSFLASNIIGATNLQQLEENINSADINLNNATLARIEEIHAVHTYPAP